METVTGLAELVEFPVIFKSQLCGTPAVSQEKLHEVTYTSFNDVINNSAELDAIRPLVLVGDAS